MCGIGKDAACDAYFKGLTVGANIAIIEQERHYIIRVRSVMRTQREFLSESQKLELYRRSHVEADHSYRQAVQKLQALEHSDDLMKGLKRRVPGTPEYKELRDLEERRDRAAVATQVAYEAWKVQYAHVVALRRQLDSPTPQHLGSQVESWSTESQELLDNLTSQIDKHWLSWISKAFNENASTAGWILLFAIITPIVIKAFYYFLVAPLASRRKAILIDPKVSGSLEGQHGRIEATNGSLIISSEATRVSVSGDEELLIHPEYLHTAAEEGIKSTKWLLDCRAPLTSIAAGLYGLTLIRSANPSFYDLSPQADPLARLAIIRIPSGSALVLQPHKLVGLIQPRDQPVRISKHWFVGTLHAWLTLQFRYLVFQGPSQLILKGHGGIVAEGSGQGRAVNQAATIGFTANLAYSTVRSATFYAYLNGKQELLDDRFAGGPGVYLHEQMPLAGKRSGLYGRGLEGLTDTVLRMFGD